MQALIRPWPGGTWLQKRAISGLHACRTTRAPGRICAIAPEVHSNKTAPAASTFFVIMVSVPPIAFREAVNCQGKAQPYYYAEGIRAMVSPPTTDFSGCHRFPLSLHWMSC